MRVAKPILVAALVIATTAYAQEPAKPESAADQAFREGRELLKAGKFAQACEQFEKSQKLDPALGTLFNIGACAEQIGRLATAAAAYRELVAKDTNEQRKAASAERLKVIEPRLSKLFVKVDKPPQGLVVEIDSKAGPRTIAPNKPIEVDFGEYTVLVRARGYNEFMSRVKINQEANTTTVEATLRSGASNADALGANEEADGPGAPGMPRRKLYAFGAMGVGGATFVTGVVFGVLARSKWNDAKAVCDGACTTPEDVDRANDIGSQARSKATLSTVFTIAGLAIAAGGVVLYVTMPAETRIAPTASDTGAGVTFSGRF